MRVLPLSVLALALAVPARAGTARVEIVPELGGVGKAPSATAGQGAVTLQLASNALVPALSFAAPAPALAPALAPPALVAPAAAKPPRAEARPLVIKTLAAPALDVSKLATGDSGRAAEADFNARAQLDAPSALAADAVSAPAAPEPSLRPRAALAPFARTPQARRAPADAGGAIESPDSLRALAEAGESRLLVLGADGRWSSSSRSGAGAYPTADEIADAAGREGRFFIASKAGLVEWNPLVPEEAADALRRGPSRWALRVPGLSSLVLSRQGVAARRVSWPEVLERGLSSGEAPLNEHVLVARTIPAFIAEEFPVIAAKLGRAVDAAYKADVLKRSNGYRLYWHSATTYKDHPDHLGIPDGHFRSDFGIRLMIKPDWRKLKDLSANFRPLYAHEYVHWLQNEGFVSTKYGAEIAAVAVEVLRAVELVGLDAVRAGRAGTVHPGVLGSFEGGREWALSGFKNETTPYSKGALAGAAYEAGAAAGRPEAAWEFLNLVIAGKGALEPADAWARAVRAK